MRKTAGYFLFIIVLTLGICLTGCVNSNAGALDSNSDPQVQTPSDNEKDPTPPKDDEDEEKPDLPSVEKFTVTFNTHDGSSVAAYENTESGSCIKEPAAPVKNAFDFSGWFSDEGCKTAWIFETNIITSNTTLHAKWSASDVVFNVSALDNAVFKTPYSAELGNAEVNGGTIIYSFVGNTPEGLAINEQSGCISGVITASAAVHEFTVRAACQETQIYKDAAFSLTVNKKPVTVTAPTLESQNATLVYSAKSPTIITETMGGTVSLDEPRLLTVGENVPYAWTFVPADTNNYVWSELKGTICLTVERANKEAPVAVLAAAFGENAATVVLSINGEGIEFRIKGSGKWQDSNVFTNLNTDEIYIFCARYKQTETHFASSSANTEFTTTVTESSVFEISNNSLISLTPLGKTLGTITVPDSVTAIKTGAFDGSLAETIIVPNIITALETVESDTDGMPIADKPGAFGGCFNLKNLTLPLAFKGHIGAIFGTISTEETTPVESNHLLFYIPLSLKSITVCGTRIHTNVLQNCTMITNITVENTVTRIEENAFAGCSGLESVSLPFIGTAENTPLPLSYLFGGFPSSLQSVTVTNTARMADGVFENCTSITEINLPETLTAIGNNAFASCTSLKSITVPTSVVSIAAGAFVNCTSLEFISLPFVGTSADASGMDALFGTIFHNPVIGSYTNSANVGQFYNISFETARFYVPLSIRTVCIMGTAPIKYGAFSSCTMLSTVFIADTVPVVEDYAFAGCENLRICLAQNTTTPIGWWERWSSLLGDSLIETGCTMDCIT